MCQAKEMYDVSDRNRQHSQSRRNKLKHGKVLHRNPSEGEKTATYIVHCSGKQPAHIKAQAYVKDALGEHVGSIAMCKVVSILCKA